MDENNPPRTHVLIVEDEKSLASVLRERFTKEGYQVSIARNGKEGLDAALAARPDILIVDLIMPKMSGMEMMVALRKDKWGANVPAIILTNLSADSGDLIRGIVEVEPSYYLVKSDWSIGEIVDKVNEVVQKA